MSDDMIVHIDTALGLIYVIVVVVISSFVCAAILYYSKPLEPTEGEV